MTVRDALERIGRPATCGEVAAVAGCSRCACYSTLARLTEAGEVTVSGSGTGALYQLAGGRP